MEKVLTDFVKALRNSNVRVSPAETIDAVSVVDTVGYEDKDLLKRTLSIVLPKTPEEKKKFEDCFDDFFTDEIKQQISVEANELTDIKDIDSDLAKKLLEGSQGELMLSIADAAEEAEIREIRYFTQRSVFTRRILEKMGVGKLEDELMQMGASREDELPSQLEQELRNQLTNLRERVSDYVQQQFLLHGDVSGEQLREQVFKSMNMAQIDRSYLHEVHSLVRKMAKKLANLHSRRKKNFKKGKLDIRKTIRDNWVNQGILFDLSWAYKKVDRPKIYVICDVSGSVGAYARFMLMFLFSLTEVVSKLRAFVFSSNLGEVTNDFKDAQLDEAIEKALQKHGGGSTDYGQALTDFVSLCLDEIDKKTTVVILGDARNNFGPEKAHLMKSINERAKQVFWLNPEGKYRWDTGDSVMTTYSAYCTKVFQCGNIDQLERVISTLLKTAKGRTVMMQFDVHTGRPYDRINKLCGTKAVHNGYPSRLYIDKEDLSHWGHQWLNQKEYQAYRNKYTHPMITQLRSKMELFKEGHGGMDFVMIYRLISCLNKGLPLDMNVYDGVIWSAITPLSEISVGSNSNAIKMPDFMGGLWKEEQDLEIMRSI